MGAVHDRYLCKAGLRAEDGGFLLAGDATLAMQGTDFWLMKIDGEGELQWSSAFRSEETMDHFEDIIIDTQGNYVLTGITEPIGGQGPRRLMVMKTNAEGELLWRTVYAGAWSTMEAAIIETNDGNYALSSMTSIDHRAAVCLFIIDTDGDEIDLITYLAPHPTAYHWVDSIIQTADGGFAISGSHQMADADKDLFLIRTDEDGDLLWDRWYDNDDLCLNNRFQGGLIETPDGGFVTAGRRAPSPGDPSIYLAKTDSSGEMLWTANYGGEFDQTCNKISMEDNHFVMSGYTDLPERQHDFYIMKTNVDPVSAPIIVEPFFPKNISISSVYPNPFNNATIINYELLKNDYISIHLYNQMGQFTTNLFQSEQTIGQHSLTWNAGELPAGNYLLRMVNQTGEAVTARLTLTK